MPFPSLSEATPISLDHLIQRVATGPRLSKDLTREEAREGMRLVLGGGAHPVQSAIFLIALRMKRESVDENLGLLDALREFSVPAVVNVPELVDVSDPYDGFTRCLPVTPFLPALLAACGVPAVCHGAQSMGPKFGLTHSPVLSVLGIPVDLSPHAAAARLEHAAIGWAYVDQAAISPALHALRELRRLMVKRTALSTLERIMGPLRATRTTHLLTGYVHAAYPEVYDRLARAAGFDSATMVRGIEGAAIPSLRQDGRAWCYRDAGPLLLQELDPSRFGIVQDARAVPVPHELSTADMPGRAAVTARMGLAALADEPGPARDALLYAAALCLWRMGREPDPGAAARRVREVLGSGEARARMEAARA